MRVVLRTGGGEDDVEVAVHDPAATVADLAAAVGWTDGAAAGVLVDGVVVPGPTPLSASGLRPGCDLAPATATTAVATAPPPDHEAELLVVGGVAAGARHRLRRGQVSIGRNPSSGVVLPTRTTSGRHAVLAVESADSVSLADAGSTSGTWIDGRRVGRAEPLGGDAVAAAGASLFRVRAPTSEEPAVLGPAGPDGRRPLHRPPAAAVPQPPAPVAPPSPAAPVVDAPRFGWAAAMVPLVGGLVLARFVDPRLALFTLLGPAVLIGQWLEDRRRHRRRHVDGGLARHAELATFAAALEAAGRIEVDRRLAIHPDPAALGEVIEAAGSGLWSRRPGHPAFLEITVGHGPALGWTPPTTKAAEGPAAQALAAARLPHGCPVPVLLRPGSHLGICGPREAALAVARWAVLQLAAHAGPADLRIAVVCARSSGQAWRWAAFLPHTVAPGGQPLLAAGPEQAGEIAALRSAVVAAASLVVVVDGDGLVDGGGPAASLIGGAASITIGPSRRALPGRCTAVLELDGRDGWGRLATGGATPQVVLATGVDGTRARDWARRLAGLADPETAGGGAPPPAAAHLLDLLQLDQPTAGDVRRRWSTGTGATAPLGCSGGPKDVEPVHVDLVADGPHALVAGTTGAGKSELLRSLVAGLAASTPPDRLALLLVDYKGGAAFADAARLPHVIGVVTDLGPDEAARALHSLDAELRRREGVLAELGLRDLADHPAHRRGPRPAGVEPLPRLVVVVDELAALVAELPSFLDDLVQLAARGRSLGLHLVLATQRPGSVVSAAVRTNCALRCCLRVPDEADAVDVVGSPAPAHLHRRQPGRAYLRRGAGDLVELQVALVGSSHPVTRRPVTVEPATFGPGPRRCAEGEVGTSDLSRLVDACRAAADEAGLAPAPPIWLPPLPRELSASDLPRGDGDEVVVGLIDDPGRQRRLELRWRPLDGPLVAAGTGSGPTRALQAATRVLAARLDPGRLHVYGLDLGSQGLASLADLPHVGALVRPGEHERLQRLVQRLGDDLARRQAAAATAAPDRAVEPLVLVLVDGTAGLQGAMDGAGGFPAVEALERVVVDGAGLGLIVAVAADRLAAVPAAWAAAASLRLAFRGGDPLDLLPLGVRRADQSRWPDGRCLDLTSGLLAQVATGGWSPPAALDRRIGGRGPAPVRTLPDHVPMAAVLAAGPPGAGEGGLHLPVGVDGRDLGIAVARLRPGQAFLICGPPGSGRTTALAAVGAAAEAQGCDVVAADTALAERLASQGSGPGAGAPLVVLVDDAERVADPEGTLAALVEGLHPTAHLVATTSVDGLRRAFGHWTAGLRRSGTGLVLRPRSELDGDVLGISVLPRCSVPLTGPGRGYLVGGGEAVPVQVASP